MRCLYISLIVSTYIYGGEVRSTPSFQGFRGIINTPNSEVIKEGTFEFLYNNQVKEFSKLKLKTGTSLDFREEKNQKNFFLNMGILPNLELNFQYVYATNDLESYNHGSLYPRNNNYLNNRTVGMKYQIPFIPKELFSASIGIEDMAGANSYIGSQYLVASKQVNNIRGSIGYAKGDNIYSLDGVFGSIEYQPLSWLQLAGEYDTKEWNGAIKAEYPIHVGNRQVNVGAMLKSSIDYKKLYLGLYADLPFNSKSKLLKRTDKNLQSIVTLDNLKLSNSYLDKSDDVAYFEYENNLYVYSDIDTLGVVLGTLATTLKSKKIQVAIKKSNMVQYQIEVDREEYLFFLKSGKYRSNLLKFIYTANREDVLLKHNDRFKPTLTLTPDMVVIDGSEYSDVIDYTLAMQAELSMRLAKGTILSGRYNIPLSQSFNFEEKGIFSYRNRNKTSTELDQLLLSQYLKFGTTNPWVTLAQVGRFDNALEGVSLESSLSSSGGEHQLLLKVAKVEDSLKDMDKYTEDRREEKLLSYRYYFDKMNSNIKLTAGEFLYGDKGEAISLVRYFNDLSFNFDLSHTTHDKKGTNNFFRFTLSIPFGTEQYIKTDYVDVKGGLLKYDKIKTIVSSGASYPLSHHFKEIENSFTLKSYYLNQDRFHPVYIKENHNRLRNVFLGYKE